MATGPAGPLEEDNAAEDEAWTPDELATRDADDGKAPDEGGAEREDDVAMRDEAGSEVDPAGRDEDSIPEDPTDEAPPGEDVPPEPDHAEALDAEAETAPLLCAAEVEDPGKEAPDDGPGG
jgi:hypothetical protein